MANYSRINYNIHKGKEPYSYFSEFKLRESTLKD